MIKYAFGKRPALLCTKFAAEDWQGGLVGD